MEDRAVRELISKSCFVSKQSVADQTLLVVNISNWHNFITEDEIVRYTKGFELLSLVLEDVGRINNDVLDWLRVHVGPRLVELTVDSCPEFSIKQLKKLLSNSYSLG